MNMLVKTLQGLEVPEATAGLRAEWDEGPRLTGAQQGAGDQRALTQGLEQGVQNQTPATEPIPKDSGR